MLLLTIAAISAVLLSPAYAKKPVDFQTMQINYAPDHALDIKEGETQIFRAPLCKGDLLNGWSFKAKVYMMNEPWDSAEIGDANWLHIQVSNGPSFTKIVRDNAQEAKKAGFDPKPSTSPFTYDSATWGSDDIYIQITASHGTPTFQYGLELAASEARDDLMIPDGMDSVETVSENAATRARGCGIETLEQVAIPLTAKLTSGDTGQYKIPFCFEDTYDQRSLTLTTLVPETVDELPGGVASFLCTDTMMNSGICYRAVVTNRGTKFYDSSGAKVNAVIPTIPKAEYGPVYLLVLAQGNYHDKVEFTITTKLRNPSGDELKLTGHSEKDLHSVLTYLKSSYENKPAPLDHGFQPEEAREEL